MLNINIPEEFQSEPLGQLAEKYREVIMKNYDPRKKDIGDRVIIWDESGYFDENTNPILKPTCLLQEMIVIEKDEDKFNTQYFMGECYNLHLDLLLYAPKTGLKFRTTSELCKIIN